MQRWEYRVIYNEAKEADFNQLGKDGWELVSTYTTTTLKRHRVPGDDGGGVIGAVTDSIVHIFKRLLP